MSILNFTDFIGESDFVGSNIFDSFLDVTRFAFLSDLWGFECITG